MTHFNEDTVEQAALGWLAGLGYTVLPGGTIAPGEPAAERSGFNEVVLLGRLRAALERLNPHIPAAARPAAIDEAVRKLTRPQMPDLLHNNHAAHRLLVEGVDISYRLAGGLKHDKLWLLDFDHPERNDWLAVNQFTVTDVNPLTRAPTNRRPDIVLFANGLPLVVIELKNPADETATVKKAFNQFQTYKQDIPGLFTTNAALVISDDSEARAGSLTAGWEWFKPWRTLDGLNLAPAGQPQLETLLKGMLAPVVLLDLLRYFTVFEVEGANITKRLAGYHQYHAVNRAVADTVRAASAGGDRRVGVVWHTQGSGKSLSMLFYAGKIIQQPALENPTLIILTDRNDLDDQLFGAFAAGQALLRQAPQQATDREQLRQLLQVASGGVVFTTIQKFRPEGRTAEYPLLSERRNIVFIADEAHRSQYGFEARLVKSKDEQAGYLAYGFAKYVRDALPNASFIGFTGTPVESTDINTPQVFGDYIDIYDLYRAVQDGATVPIYYQGRLARLRLKEEQRPQLDPGFEEVTEGEEVEGKEKLKSKWSRLEALVGAEERLAQVAADIVAHFEGRLEALEGKGMIVCMSRRICVALYDQIIRLRPEWHDHSDERGALKIVMTGSAGDPAHFQPHLRSKARRKGLAERFKDPDDPLKLVIVRDMWLTGFDVPPLHTMYLDKPMAGHSLMQAIARANRVWKDKPGGLIVDYLGIAPALQEALAMYAGADKKLGGGLVRETPVSYQVTTIQPQEQAVALLQTELEIVRAFFHRFDYSPFFNGSPAQRLALIPAAMEHILPQPDGKKRYLDAVTRLSKAFALAVPDERALAWRDEIAFFQAVRAAFVKVTPVDARSREDMEGAIQQLLSQAVAATDVIDIFEAAGLKAPNIAILSDEFLQEVRRLPQQNLALELLRKLINDEIRARSRKNIVQARSFSELLDQTLIRYQNRSIDTVQVITELIELAKEMRETARRGQQLGLNEEEQAFYDALAANSSAVEVLGNTQLAFIAHELLKVIRQNVTIDWTLKQSARAKLRLMVKKILRRHGYPPDLQEAATQTVLEQAERIAADWIGA